MSYYSVILAMILSLMVILLRIQQQQQSGDWIVWKLRHRYHPPDVSFQIVFFAPNNKSETKLSAINPPPPFDFPALPMIPIPSDTNYHYNGLQIQSPHYNNNSNSTGTIQFQRFISSNDLELLQRERLKTLVDSADGTIPYPYWYQEDIDGLHHFSCRRPAWTQYQFINCNTFHEISFDRDYPTSASPRGNRPTNNNNNNNHRTEWSLQDYDNYLINHGFYRDVWVNKQPSVGTTTIIKTTRYQFDFGWRNIFDVHREALIMERLTPFNNIVTSYGHCGTSVITEALPFEIQTYIVPPSSTRHHPIDPSQQHQSRNKLSLSEKVSLALAMAESIAVLHGFQDGVIVHDDIQLQQWLRSSDGTTIKLGDFNRATILDWNDKEQRYCKYSNGEAFGNYRSPEEFDAGYLDEKIDVYSFSNNIYCILTGLEPFYETNDDSVVQRKVSEGHRPNVTIPNTSTTLHNNDDIEQMLLNVMHRGWTHTPDDRISIFEAVRLLRRAQREVGTHSRKNR